MRLLKIKKEAWRLIWWRILIGIPAMVLIIIISNILWYPSHWLDKLATVIDEQGVKIGPWVSKPWDEQNKKEGSK